MKRFAVLLLISLSIARGQSSDTARVRILAVGDMNLGRSVGQVLLKDSVEYPFAGVSAFLATWDVVFGNLESQITDQDGETQHPRDRYIFAAPPQAAQALKLGGFTVVSTANNHAFDYGTKALEETIGFLDAEGVMFTGTSRDSTAYFPAALVTRRDIVIGFLAYTEFVNRKGAWGGKISLFQSARARKEIAALREKADLVVVSYHGGVEYVDSPPKYTLAQMRALADAGADVVLGHHPHVPQGIERRNGAWIVYSLGNFVFNQPQRTWTQRSYAVSFEVSGSPGKKADIRRIEIWPLRASNQPTFAVEEKERNEILDRVTTLSNVSFSRKDSTLVVEID